MSREDLLKQIVTELRTPSTAEESDITEAVLCQNCGIRISHENNSDREELEDYIVHRIPDHGTQEVSSVFYCGRDCFQRSMEALFDYSDETSSIY